VKRSSKFPSSAIFSSSFSDKQKNRAKTRGIQKKTGLKHILFFCFQQNGRFAASEQSGNQILKIV